MCNVITVKIRRFANGRMPFLVHYSTPQEDTVPWVERRRHTEKKTDDQWENPSSREGNATNIYLFIVPTMLVYSHVYRLSSSTSIVLLWFHYIYAAFRRRPSVPNQVISNDVLNRSNLQILCWFSPCELTLHCFFSVVPTGMSRHHQQKMALATIIIELGSKVFPHRFQVNILVLSNALDNSWTEVMLSERLVLINSIAQLAERLPYTL